MAIPLADERVYALGQGVLVREIDNAQPFALQNAEPLLHLIHPGAMHRRMMEVETGMLPQPGFDQLAFVHPQVVQHDVSLFRLPRLTHQHRQKIDELRACVPRSGLPIDGVYAG